MNSIGEFMFQSFVIYSKSIMPAFVSHKKKDGLGFFARRGSSWLLEKVTQRKCVKCQADHETCKSTGNWKKREYGEVS